jgi:uncharacterized protein YprB with RNaseH-like and TPR domain
MDIKDELDFLRKGKGARVRPRSVSVEQTWSRLSGDDALSVKEKLEKLINLTGTKKTVKPAAPDPEIEIEIERARCEPLLFLEHPYPLSTKYGRHRLEEALAIKGDVLFRLSHDVNFEELDLSTALFLDLETTGLSGGTGTVPFLVGLGYFRDGRFNVGQFFLGELGEEERMIQDLGRFFGEMDFRSVVTYNGKAFDMPLLETRFIMFREALGLSRLPHLDLLYTARRLWKHKHESCRLFHLAQQIVQADRDEDIPSAEIPFRYFNYLRSGDFSLIDPILYHNQEDILSLLGLVISASVLFAEDGEIDALDLFGVGKVYESHGDMETSAAFYERALAGDLPEEVAVAVKHKLSTHFKRNADWDKALHLWRDLSARGDLVYYRDMAIYFEHKARDFAQAKRISEEGLALAIDLGAKLREDFARRLDRLNGKLAKGGGVKRRVP